MTKYRVDHRRPGERHVIRLHFDGPEAALLGVEKLLLRKPAWYQVCRLSDDGMEWKKVEEGGIRYEQ